ncbi:MAG: hypothetical protein Q9224_002742 [Gallowayella concinna]
MSVNEQTPLITTVHVVPRQPRYRHSTLRRFCTIALSTTLIVVVVLFLVPINWLPHHNWNDDWDDERQGPQPWASPYVHKAWPAGQRLSYSELQDILLNTPNETKAREWSEYYTSGPHLAGKNLTQALWTRERWQQFGVSDSSIATYDVYLNYPLNHRLALLESKSRKSEGRVAGITYDVRYECSMEEDVLEEDPTTGLDNRVPTFHGYSASGNVTAQYVYVNFGTHWDFEDLLKANVSLEGNIAIAKYGRGARGVKVKRAEQLGMAGIVIYSDPQEDGEITEKNGYKTYPGGPARNPSSVQRGSVLSLDLAPGDPTTVGYPSKPGVPRQDPGEVLPSIPSVPISYQDALPLLRSLNGHGPAASEFNEYWQGGGLDYLNVSYNIGPSPSSLKLHLVNQQEYVTTPIWNVIGVINGTLADEVVVLGNHRDAWVAGGAADPNSASAALNEVIRSFGVALERGWKPLRTIVFASWDGEEYGMVGSTEWVEEYLPWLSHAAVAYLNVDMSTTGPEFSAKASPVLHRAMYEATALVQSPNQTVAGQTVRDIWSGPVGGLGSGSDYTAFQDYAGVPSIHMTFKKAPNGPVYHYHSNYDSFHWMENYGDKGWRYHTTMTKIWALAAASLVDSPIIPFSARQYGKSLASYLHAVKEKASKSGTSNFMFQQVAFHNLELAVGRLKTAAMRFDQRASLLEKRIKNENIPWWRWWQKVKLQLEVKRVNDGYKYLERQFLYEEGLDGRNWYKHVVYAPGRYSGYAGATFPGLVEGLEDGNETAVEKWTMASFVLRRPFAITSALKQLPKATSPAARAFHSSPVKQQIFSQRSSTPITTTLSKSRSTFQKAFRRYDSSLQGIPNPAAGGSLGQRLLAGGAMIGGGVLAANLLFNRETREDGGMPLYERSFLNETFLHTGVGIGIIGVAASALHRSGWSYRLMAANPWVVLGGGLVFSLGTMYGTFATHPDNYLQKYALWGGFNIAQAAVLSPLLFLQPALLARAGLYTVAMMGSIAYVGATAKQEKYLYLGGPLLAGLALVAVSGFAPLVLPATAARTLMWSERIWLYGGLAVFGGFTLYDTQKILHHARMAQRGLMTKDVVNESIKLELDFLNIFIRMVQILGMQQRRK